MKITGWFGNREDTPGSVEVTDATALAFMESRYYSPDLPVFDRLVLWVASEDGRNLAWDPRDADNEAAMDDLYHRVRRLEGR